MMKETHLNRIYVPKTILIEGFDHTFDEVFVREEKVAFHKPSGAWLEYAPSEHDDDSEYEVLTKLVGR